MRKIMAEIKGIWATILGTLEVQVYSTPAAQAVASQRSRAPGPGHVPLGAFRPRPPRDIGSPSPRNQYELPSVIRIVSPYLDAKRM